jgi:hypothetical protein
MLRGKWWQVFNDPALNALEEQLNINNQNIKQSFQDFMEARALIAQAHSQYWPTITVNPLWTRQKTSGNLTNSPQANTGRTGTLISFPVDVSWVPDFWGRIRNEVREYQYNAQISAADLEVERLTEEASLRNIILKSAARTLCRKFSTTLSRPIRNRSSWRKAATIPAWTTTSRSRRRKLRSTAHRLQRSMSVLHGRSTNMRSPCFSAGWLRTFHYLWTHCSLPRRRFLSAYLPNCSSGGLT